MHVLTIFVAPCFLENEHGRKFANTIIAEDCGMFIRLEMVHGKPSHSQSKGSV